MTHDRLHDQSTPIPPEVREQMERALSDDLGDVQLHAGPDAHRAADEVDATAFTTGNDIVLGASAPPLSSAAGNALLAHELTHVVQQRRAAHVVDGISSPTDAAEHAAAAHHAASAGTVHAVQRQEKTQNRTVSRDEVEHVLSDYLSALLRKQRRPNLEFTPEVLDVLGTLFGGNRMLATSVADAMKGKPPAEVARYIAAKLPATIPEDRIGKIRVEPTVVAPMDTPRTFTDASLGRFIDHVVRPILRGLPKDAQDKVLRAVKDAAAAGSVVALKAGLDKAGLSGPALEGVTSAFENALTKEPGTTTDRQQEGAGNPGTHKEMSPSVAPEAPKAEGEETRKAPPVPFQEPGVRPPADRDAPEVRVDLAAERLAAAVDPNLLVPPGTPEKQVGSYPRGQVWALDAARRLEQGHRDRDQTVRIELGSQYGPKTDVQVLDRAQKTVLELRDALPHHCPALRSVVLTAGGQPVRAFALHPSP